MAAIRVVAPALLLLVALAVALLVGGCASQSAEAPKPITEADVRAKLSADRTASALRELKDDRARELLDRAFDSRRRNAQQRGLQYAVERVLIGEDIGIGAGARLQRAFALSHEYDDKAITSYLEAIEMVGGRIRQTLRSTVGQNGKRLVTLELVDLNRAGLRTYRFAGNDAPCCPSVIVDTIYAWRGLTLEELR